MDFQLMVGGDDDGDDAMIGGDDDGDDVMLGK